MESEQPEAEINPLFHSSKVYENSLFKDVCCTASEKEPSGEDMN
ncbi:hypothetical protein [Bacillus sp. MUM 13]|nr:hypothetical protein [Bacillus sp. MUM 13]